MTAKWRRLWVLIISFLKIVTPLGVLVAVSGCATILPPPASQAQVPGATITVIDGTLIVSHLEVETTVNPGSETTLSKGYRITTGPGAGATLSLPDQSILLLDPSTTLQVVKWSQTEDIILRGLAGVLTLTSRSGRVSLETSSVTSFGLDSLQVRVTSVSDGTIVRLSVYEPNVQLVVEEGEASVSVNDDLYHVGAGTKVEASPGAQPEIVAVNEPRTTTPSPEVAEGPTPMATPLSSNSQGESYPYPALILLEPEPQASMVQGDPISLKWEPTAQSDPNAWYEVQLWKTDAAPFTVVGRVQSAAWSPESELQVGTYRWRIQVVRLSDGVYLSPPSETREFVLSRASTTSATPQPARLPTLPPSSSSTASSYSKPVASLPANEAIFQAEDTINLSWDSAGTLQGNQWYEVRLWENGTDWRGTVKTQSPFWQVSDDYGIGRFGWQVAVILTQDGKWVKDISPQSEMRFFIREAPPSVGSDDDDSGGAPPSRR